MTGLRNRLLFGAGVLTASLGCPPPEPEPESVASVTISPLSDLFLVVGDQQQLTATAWGTSGAALSGRAVRWASSNAAVATVGETSGMVSAMGPGSARITATVEGRSGSVTALVSMPAQPLSVTLEGNGHGTVTSSPAGINCVRGIGGVSGTCSAMFMGGIIVTLTAQGTGIGVFTGWGGVGCGPAATCQVTMTGPRAVSAAFYPPFGAVTVTVSGLPPGAEPMVTLNRSGSPAIPVTSTLSTLSTLSAGTWTVNAHTVYHGGAAWLPSVAAQPVTITAGGTASVTVTYARALQNLRIASAYITQAIQNTAHQVHLVAGREAWLRVFAVATRFNTLTPRVRAKLWHGNTEVWGSFLSANSASVTGSIEEGNLQASWNIRIPGHLIQPGLRLWADVDPDGTVPEADETDNEFPVSGSPLAITVRGMPQINFRMIPVRQQGRLGHMDGGSYESYLLELRWLLPFHDWGASIGHPLESRHAIRQPLDDPGWSAILSELNTRRAEEWWFPRWFFVGAVSIPWGGPGDLTRVQKGIGYRAEALNQYEARVALVSDQPNSRGTTYAHELGHNLGRRHASTPGTPDVDPDYPYPNGVTGIHGLHPATQALHYPDGTDIMGYVWPGQEASYWVSAYTWQAVLNGWTAVGGAPIAAPSAAGDAADGLMIWGRDTPDGLLLEPAFRTVPSTERLPSTGRWRVEGLDDAGRLLFSQAFDAAEVAHSPSGPSYHFAVLLPLGSEVLDRIATLRVSGPRGEAMRQVFGGPAAAPGDDLVTRTPAGEVRWDADRYPLGILRYPDTGEIRSFIRDGRLDPVADAGAAVLQLSDGVGRVGHRIVIR